MIVYHVKFNLKNGRTIQWSWKDKNMEAGLASAKHSIKNVYGDQWTGGIMICGPQGDNGPYCF